MQVNTTSRGFERCDFTDRNGEGCSIQQSSAIGDEAETVDFPGSSLLWLGVNDLVPKVLIQDEGWQPIPLPPDTLTCGRMHLDRKTVKELVTVMRRWLRTGRLSIPATQPRAD